MENNSEKALFVYRGYMKKPLVVVDADTLVFRSAAASEERSVLVKHLPSNREKVYKNRTSFKKAMQEKGYQISPDEFQFEDIQEAEPVANCLHTIKRQAESIKERFSDSEVIFCCGDSNNFRLDLPLPARYKNNREGMLLPLLLKEAKEYFCNKFKAKSANGYEVDDLVFILAYEGLSKGRDVILASPDKDSKQGVGLKLFDYTKPERDIVTVQEWHPVELNDKKEFKSYGIPWLAYQCLVGDSTDCFKPTELCKAKFGNVGAYNLLKGCNTPKDCLEAVVSKYKEWYPEPVTYTAWNGKEYNKDWKDILQLYFKCCKMKFNKNDNLDCFALLDKYGVTL